MIQETYFYPRDWREISCLVKAANGYCCQACGKQCRRPGEFYLGRQYELTVAHLDHGYEAEATTVAALCAPCHLRYDAAHSWLARRRWARHRRRVAGQLALFA